MKAEAPTQIDRTGDSLKAMLRFHGFSVSDTFGEFITYQRPGNSLKVQVGPDGSFTVFANDQTAVEEGTGVQSLFSFLAKRRMGSGSSTSWQQYRAQEVPNPGIVDARAAVSKVRKIERGPRGLGKILARVKKIGARLTAPFRRDARFTGVLLHRG